MRMKQKMLLSLLASTFLSTAAIAAVNLEPTLDKLKSDIADLKGNYALTELSGDLPDGVTEVEINGIKYYFNPNGVDNDLLVLLASTPAGQLIEAENGIFELNGQKYNFNISSIPNSAFSYAEGTAEDYNFAVKETDTNGNLTTKYYKIVFTPQIFESMKNVKVESMQPASGDTLAKVEVNLPNGGKQTFYYNYKSSSMFENTQNISWKKTDNNGVSGITDDDLTDGNIKGTVSVILPDNTTEYYEYTYTLPDGYTESNVRIDNALGTANVTNVVFNGIVSSLNGGAIYNTKENGEIDIVADFINNTANGEVNVGNSGGAIFNDENAKIGNISGNFIGNHATYGGVIYHDANAVIGNITGNFIGNYAGDQETYGDGGVIYSYYGKIGNINANFIGNHASNGGVFSLLRATIGDISGNFIGNYVDNSNYPNGGAIDKLGGTIGNITGNFIGNYISGVYEVYGGAISNVSGGSYTTSHIGNLTGDYIGNYVVASDVDGYAYGGAIYNNSSSDVSSIGDIKGDFIGNYARVLGDEGYTYGGAIHNSAYGYYSSAVKIATIGDLTGNYVGNHAAGSEIGLGGAIYNIAGQKGTATIGNITGDFIGNYVTGNYMAAGGAIYNSTSESDGKAVIGDISGNFIGNYATGGSYKNSGGAIYNENGTIGNVTGNFIGNYTSGLGGAIYNTATHPNKEVLASIGDITGDFIDNHASGSGGAIAHYGSHSYQKVVIGNVTGDFIGNYSINGSGGAIYVSTSGGSPMENITGDFIGNHASGSGGAIYNRLGISGVEASSIGNVKGDFVDNYSEKGSGGAIYNVGNVSIGNITGNFIGNHAFVSGGAIHSEISNYSSSGSFGDIKGDFIQNFVSGTEVLGGAVFLESGNEFDLVGNFVDNHAFGTNFAQGGAVYNNGYIDNISGIYIDNYAESIDSYATGGAIVNFDSISSIKGDFSKNYAKSLNSYAQGGAVYNGYRSYISSIEGNFVGNYASAADYAYGGALYNDASIWTIKGDLANNFVSSASSTAAGGAIYNTKNAIIDDVRGDFIGNYAVSNQGNAYGGAVYNDANVTVQGSELPDNLIFHINLKYGDQEIELYIPRGESSSENMQIVSGTMTVDSEEVFNQFKKTYSFYTYLLELSPDNITAETYVDLMIKSGQLTEEERDQALEKFYQLSAEKQKETLEEMKTLVVSTQEMVNNATHVTEITPVIDVRGQLNFYNSSLRNNYVRAENGEALGGAVYGSGIKVTADNYTSFIDGNKANDKSNAFYVLNKIGVVFDEVSQDLGGMGIDLDATINSPVVGDLTFATINDGMILLNDGIDGESGYGLGIYGDGGIDEETLKTSQYVKVNNSIANAGTIYVSSTTLSLGTGAYGKGEIISDTDPVTKIILSNAAFDLYNGYKDEMKLAGWKSTGSYLHLDVDVDNLTTDTLYVNGNVEGQTKLVLYASSDKDIRGESIVFAQSTNDTTGNADSFKVWRVYGSPYMFETRYTNIGDNSNSWELVMNDEENSNSNTKPSVPTDPEVPDPEIPDIENPDIPNIKPQPAPGDVVEVAPEVIGSQSLPAASLAQNSNLIYSVMNKVSANRLYCVDCDLDQFSHNAWVNSVYTNLNIDAPTNVEADVWGIEAGGDLQSDVNNKIGMFLSYRKGQYDMSGQGKHYYSTIGSKIEVDSYLAGLYYRYDKDNWYGFATVYGGMQKADITTDDGVKSDTDGMEFGGGFEVGYDYVLQNDLYLTPSLGIYYSQISYDDARDNVGKEVKYNDLGQVEFEAGVKLIKTFRYDNGLANVYIKPSIVQTVVRGDEIKITGLGEIDSVDDDTLGRIELGGRYGLNQSLSAYGWANYTFGGDYASTTLGIGLNYAF